MKIYLIEVLLNGTGMGMPPMRASEGRIHGVARGEKNKNGYLSQPQNLAKY